VDRVVDSGAELESGASLRPLPRLSPSGPANPTCLSLSKDRFLRGLSSTGRNAVLQYAKHRRYHLNFLVTKHLLEYGLSIACDYLVWYLATLWFAKILSVHETNRLSVRPQTLSGMTIAHVPPLAGSGLALILFP